MSEAKNTGNRLFRAAGVVAIFFLLTRLFGLLKTAAMSAAYGTGIENTAFQLALSLPDLIFGVVAGGALGSAFIPTFSGYLVNNDDEGGWNLFSAVLNFILILMTILAIVGAIFAEPIIRVFYIDMSKPNALELLALAVPMTRIMLLSIIIFGASSVFMALLNAKQHFFAPALAGVMYNLGIILGTVLFAPNIFAVAWGAVAGSAMHALVQVPFLFQNGVKYRPIFRTNDGGVRQVLTLMGPRVIGLSFSYLNIFLVPNLARTLVDAAVVGLRYANQIMLVPYSLLGQSVGVVSFPTLSAMAAEGKTAEMQRVLNTALRSILFLGLPITLGLVLLRIPIVRILLERGEFTSSDTRLVAVILLLYAFAILPLAGLEVVTRAFYSMQDTWTPVIAGMAQLILMYLMSRWFVFQVFPAAGWEPAAGIALGFSLSNWIETSVLILMLQNRIGGLNGRDLLDGLWRMGLATLIMTTAVWGILMLLVDISPWLLIPIAGGVGAVVYFGVSHLLGVRELARFTNPILARLGVRGQD